MLSEGEHPSFALALIAVLAAQVIAGMISTLFLGFVVMGDLSVRYFIGGVVGAVALRMIVRVMQFDISFAAAAVAMFIGVVALALRSAFPSSHVLPIIPLASSLGGLASLLIAAWITQMSAARPRRELPL